MSVRARRPSRLVSCVVAAAVALSVGAWAALGAGGGGEPAPSGYQVVQLGNGAAVAIGTPREGLLTMLWRDHGGDWSPAARLRVPHSGSLTYVGSVASESSAAAHVTLLGPLDAATGEPSGPVHEAFVACRERHCDTRVAEAGTTASSRPQLTSDGHTAYFGRSAAGYLVWRAGHAVRDERPTGLPRRTTGRSEPLLARDGSFRVVQGVRAGGACRMTLFTSGAADTTFTESVSFRRALPSSRPACGSSLGSVRSDAVTVSTVRSAPPVFLARHDGSWSTVATDPSGLAHYVRTPGTVRGLSQRVGLWHGRELAIASPDGRRVTVQQRRKDDSTWSAPQTVGHIPTGTRCFDIAPTPDIHDDPFYATVRCRERRAPTADLVYSYLTIISDDGTTWASVDGTDLPLRIGDDTLFQGHPPYRWSAASGLRRVTLPVPEDATYSLLSDGTSVLTRVAHAGAGCALQVRVAAADATSWSAPVLNTTGGMPAGAPCLLPHVQTERTNAYYHYASASPSLMDRLVRRDDAWLVEPGPRP